jgi:hypothetical protein
VPDVEIESEFQFDNPEQLRMLAAWIGATPTSPDQAMRIARI